VRFTRRFYFRRIAMHPILSRGIRGGANNDLPEVREKSRASLAPVGLGLGRELALDEALPLP
jgi:hypothetical protein